jgi:hypothetical protein
MSKPTAGMFENAVKGQAAIFTGEPQTIEMAVHRDKDRLVIRTVDASPAGIAVIYLRDTPTIKAGTGYIARDVVIPEGESFGKTLGMALGKSERFTPTTKFQAMALKIGRALKKRLEAAE